MTRYLLRARLTLYKGCYFKNIYTCVASEIFNPEEPSSKSFQLASLQKAIVKRVSLNELKISNTINVLSLKIYLKNTYELRVT